MLEAQCTARDVALRRFSRQELISLGELLDRYEEMRVNDVEAVILDWEEEEKRWASAESSDECLRELERRAGRSAVPGDIVVCDGDASFVLEAAAEGWTVRRINDSSILSLGEVLDAYASVELGPPQEDHCSDDELTATAARRRTSTLMRPPPKRAVVAQQQASILSDEERDEERAAHELFVPVVARSRRERDALDAEASAHAARFAACDSEIDAESWQRARRAASHALRPSFTGIHLRRPSDVLYDALIAERRRHPWLAEPNPVYAVAALIARNSLVDPSTAPAAVLAHVTDAFFEARDLRDRDLVERALVSARLVLDALLRYHPALIARREATVAALECVDAAILGDDDDGNRFADKQMLVLSSPAADRELRYQAVLATLQARVARCELLPDDDRPNAARSTRRRHAGAIQALSLLPRNRSARGKLRILVATLEAIATDLGETGVASDDLMPALCDALCDAKLPSPAAEVAFAKTFCRDDKVLLAAEGYALTSFEIALVALQPQQAEVPTGKSALSSPCLSIFESPTRTTSDAIAEDISATS